MLVEQVLKEVVQVELVLQIQLQLQQILEEGEVLQEQIVRLIKGVMVVLEL